MDLDKAEDYVCVCVCVCVCVRVKGFWFLSLITLGFLMGTSLHRHD